MQLKKFAMEHWKYCYDYNQTFTNESNFGIKWPIESFNM